MKKVGKIFGNIGREDGYAAVASVLVITVVVVIIGTTVALLSVNDIQSALSYKKGVESLNVVDGCVEDALLRINEDESLPATILVEEGSCVVTVNSQSGNDWDFSVSGELGNYSRSVRIVAVRDGIVEVTSWVEE